jgi:hypothetical protein
MRSLHHALLACRVLLPEPLRQNLARLFDEEEHVALLAARLLICARQGVPGRRPLPHFGAECTPPLADAFGFFRPAVAAWHDDPDDPAVVQRLAAAVAAAGVGNLLVLMGQRRTPGSVTDASALPPARRTLLAAAGQKHGEADDLTAAGRALAKHAARPGDGFWGSISGPSAGKNAAAERLLVQILDAATWWNVFVHFSHGLVYEAREPLGHGARWGQGGATFIGFLEPFEEGGVAQG